MPPMAHFSSPSEDLTTMWCDTRRLTKLHFPTQHQRLNNTATSPPTAIKFLLKRESRRMKTSTTMANHDRSMNRISSFVSYELLPTTASIRRHWYLKYLIWFLQLFVDCLVCSRYCLQLPCVFIECVMLHGACACFLPLGLENPLV
jgi:hypothetical protein